MFLLLGLLACELGMDAVAISPIYGWVDGCNVVTVSGHGFSDDVGASLNGNALTNVVLPTGVLDKGFRFDAVVPTGAAAGTVDVVVNSGAVTDTITGTGGYTYVACPQRGLIEGIDLTTAAAGATVTLSGCSLDTALSVQLVKPDGSPASDTAGTPVAPAVLASSCGTATVTFTVPGVSDGAYYLQLLDETGTVISGGICPPIDTADTAAPACTDYPFTVGAAR